jgi:hypothetical protein
VVTWLFDETGNAGAILDEFCVRNIDGAPRAWVFGVSVFALKGEHIGWFEHGVLFDVDNGKLGFLAGAIGLGAAAPELSSAPPLPAFPKRPNVPALRARLARPAPSGWADQRLADYLERGGHYAPGHAVHEVAVRAHVP